MAQGDPDELIRRKVAMIKDALAQVEGRAERVILSEVDGDHPDGPNDIDCMEEMLEDDTLDTD